MAAENEMSLVLRGEPPSEDCSGRVTPGHTQEVSHAEPLAADDDNREAETSRLMALPAEVRLVIIEFATIEMKPINTHAHRLLSSPKSPTARSLALAGKTLSREVLPIYFGHNTFTLGAGDRPVITFLRSVRASVQHLRHLQVKAAIGCGQWWHNPNVSRAETVIANRLRSVRFVVGHVKSSKEAMEIAEKGLGALLKQMLPTLTAIHETIQGEKQKVPYSVLDVVKITSHDHTEWCPFDLMSQNRCKSKKLAEVCQYLEDRFRTMLVKALEINGVDGRKVAE